MNKAAATEGRARGVMSSNSESVCHLLKALYFLGLLTSFHFTLTTILQGMDHIPVFKMTKLKRGRFSNCAKSIGIRRQSRKSNAHPLILKVWRLLA